MKRALFAGRFQPFHDGHRRALDLILNEVGEVIVGVAATERNFTFEDPFTCGERIEMIWSSLRDAERQRSLVIPVPNVESNKLWPAHVSSYAPPFDLAYTNNALQTALMRDHGVDVRPIDLLDRGRLEGARLRSLLADGDPGWEDLVPVGVAAVLKRLGAPERLRLLRT